MHPEIAPSVHPKVRFFKVYSFVSCFPTIPLNRAKLKYGTMKLKASEKFIGMIGVGAIYFLELKGSFYYTLRMHAECTLGCTSRGTINEGLLSNNSFTRN